MAESAHLTVMALLYSGRRNPQWSLGPGEEAELKRRLNDLPATAEWSERPPTPGYNGFAIMNFRDTPGWPRLIKVWDGFVHVSTQETRVFRDLHGIEAWLLEQAKRQPEADEIERAVQRSQSAGRDEKR